MRERLPIVGAAIIAFLIVSGLFLFTHLHRKGGAGVSALPTPSPFEYGFDETGVLEEAGSVESSRSPYWWLDSGGRLMIEDGIGKTIAGRLPQDDVWRRTYADTSSIDTDGGYRPQNLFRLVTRNVWGDVRVESSFRIVHDNVSASPNRNESNGLLLMSRYQDGDTLYYGGIRIDGTAVIKKKYHGTYYTLAQTPVFAGVWDSPQDSLLPQHTWLTLAFETKNTEDGVALRLSVATSSPSPLTEVLSYEDSGEEAPPIRDDGAVGIRTDFMDVEFDDFRAADL